MEHLSMNEEDIKALIEQTVTTVVGRLIGCQKEWMTLAEAAKYAGVCHNTFSKFRTMGLKVSEVEGVKRVSRTEIDNFLDNHSY